jgi:hypothetical protein
VKKREIQEWWIEVSLYTDSFNKQISTFSVPEKQYSLQEKNAQYLPIPLLNFSQPEQWLQRTVQLRAN